jgi:hypothetical protein
MRQEILGKFVSRKSAIGVVVVGVGTLLGGQAVGFFGGGYIQGGYIGQLPADWYDDQVCTTAGITLTTHTVLDIRQWEIKPGLLRDDGNPNTYIRCSITASLDEMVCNVGFSDGTVLACNDDGGPHQLPGEDDTVYITMEEAPGTLCEIVIGTGDTFGIGDPKCRTPTTGSGGGGGNTPQICDASTAVAVLRTGQGTTIASNACIRLVNEGTWSSVNPYLQPEPGTNSYPVPYSYTYCGGQGSGSLTGNYINSYLVDGSSASTLNYKCDLFVKLGGNGSAVQFRYHQ